MKIEEVAISGCQVSFYMLFKGRGYVYENGKIDVKRDST